jgi:hypothetical protein
VFGDDLGAARFIPGFVGRHHPDSDQSFMDSDQNWN